MSAKLLDTFLAAGWRPAVCGDVMRADQHASVSLRITRGRLEIADAEGEPETVVTWVLWATALFLSVHQSKRPIIDPLGVIDIEPASTVLVDA